MAENESSLEWNTGPLVRTILKHGAFTLHTQDGQDSRYTFEPDALLRSIDASRDVVSGFWQAITGSIAAPADTTDPVQLDTIGRTKLHVGAIVASPNHVATSIAAVVAHRLHVPSPLVTNETQRLALAKEPLPLPAVVIESSISRTSNIIFTMQALRSIGAGPLGVYVLFDHENGAVEELQESSGVPVHALVGSSAVMATMWLEGTMSDYDFSNVVEHYEEYGTDSAKQTFRQAVAVQTQRLQELE